MAWAGRTRGLGSAEDVARPIWTPGESDFDTVDFEKVRTLTQNGLLDSKKTLSSTFGVDGGLLRSPTLQTECRGRTLQARFCSRLQ